ncbi:MAG TPA: prepilin-type N-terminal cleavage/methylation domain-containing protein, partial [Tepidisphaeraceae bacterium]
MPRPAIVQFRPVARGFSLLELIISVALVLVLMLAITKIFSITSATIGASQGIAAATRDARAAQAVFAKDIGAMASDSPFVWIRYQAPRAAFRNAEDARSDTDYNSTTLTAAGQQSSTQRDQIRTIDLDNNDSNSDGNLEGDPGIVGEIIGALQINARNHRLDQFSFCARDRFTRQTGNSNPANAELVSGMTSPEAWITYNHLITPRADGTFLLTRPDGTPSALKTEPGQGNAQNNPTNAYSSQWILGRTSMLMVLPTNAPSATPGGTANATGTNEYITNAAGVAQEFYKRKIDWTNAAQIRPFDSDTTSAVVTGPVASIRDSRYDLIGIDIENANDLITRHLV